MKLAMAAQMKAIDQNAIHQYGIPGVALMETAGGAVARQVEAVLKDVADKKICIFAGKGNNGGDGYVIARFLHGRGAKIKVFLVGKREEVSGDAKINLDILERMGIEVSEITNDARWDLIAVAAGFADCLVDALLGTGFSGEIQGDMRQTVELINRAGRLVVSVDIPSGVHADTGQIGGVAVRAAYTVTLELLKPGLLLYPGAEFAGQVMLETLGIPAGAVEEEALRYSLITVEMIRRMLPKRNPDSHKGTFGRVAVLAGSAGLSGAAALASTGALRTGAGRITLAAPAGIQAILATKLTEVMTRGLPETPTGGLAFAALTEVKQLTALSDVLLAGPGLGTQAETQELIRELIREAAIPLVLDADALNALAGHVEILSSTAAVPVLTPHPGEMARLTGLTVADIQRDRLGVAQQAAEKWKSIVVLKGARTIVAMPDGAVFVNLTGNAGMASGGTGDVLAGVIASLVAQGVSGQEAAVCGVYLHGLAGDIVAQNGMTGLTAGDVAAALPAALHGVQAN